MFHETYLIECTLASLVVLEFVDMLATMRLLLHIPAYITMDGFEVGSHSCVLLEANRHQTWDPFQMTLFG